MAEALGDNLKPEGQVNVHWRMQPLTDDHHPLWRERAGSSLGTGLEGPGEIRPWVVASRDCYSVQLYSLKICLPLVSSDLQWLSGQDLPTSLTHS